VLAGGCASRLGGADKPALEVGGASLIATVVSAAAGAGAQRIVVVGPDRRGLGLTEGVVRVVREDPPGSGPVPALRTGLAEVSASWVFVLAADLPFIRAADLGSLLAAAVSPSGPAGGFPAGDRERPLAAAPGSAGPAGAVLTDDTGRPQWLAGCWQTGALRQAVSVYQGGSLHGLLGPLSPVLLAPAPDPAGPPPWLDCDTEDDVRLARDWSGGPARTWPDAPR
jgi:CTP:molybdopterin cytidylyltransferase MocA